MSSAQRAYGQSGNNGNTNVPNTGSFGDTKGLDLWTYFPSAVASSTLNVQGPPTVLLVKRITAVNGTNTTGFDDDPGTTDDNSPYWPTPTSTYLRGVRSVANVSPAMNWNTLSISWIPAAPAPTSCWPMSCPATPRSRRRPMMG